ncbi:MAG: MOSC domain-containing protein, partial [Chloroflexota bacterium]|nr:MOSC domain-containing protein [Chloroflexota bacterium]
QRCAIWTCFFLGNNLLRPPRKMRRDSAAVEGIVETEEEVSTVTWGRRVDGHLVGRDWSRALSQFCGRPVFPVRSRQSSQCYDDYPIAILSRASMDFLSQRASVEPGMDHRRFRPNLLLDGCEPHEEDSWLGQSVTIGDQLALRVVAPDPRCAMTTLDPDTGTPDLDTPSAILSYRPSPGPAYFGVYAVVERPGQSRRGRILGYCGHRSGHLRPQPGQLAGAAGREPRGGDAQRGGNAFLQFRGSG